MWWIYQLSVPGTTWKFSRKTTLLHRSHIRCWRHDLKGFQIESFGFGGNGDGKTLTCDVLLELLPSVPSHQKTSFLLNWWFNFVFLVSIPSATAISTPSACYLPPLGSYSACDSLLLLMSSYSLCISCCFSLHLFLLGVLLWKFSYNLGVSRVLFCHHLVWWFAFVFLFFVFLF